MIVFPSVSDDIMTYSAPIATAPLWHRKQINSTMQSKRAANFALRY